jgi:hypothetical protein
MMILTRRRFLHIRKSLLEALKVVMALNGRILNMALVV